MTDKPKNPLSAMARTVGAGIAKEADTVRVGFKGNSATNNVAILGSISAGVTFALQGVRNIKSGMTKDPKTGKRDFGTTAVGVAETVGGLFLTGVFYHNLRQGTEIFPHFGKSKGDSGPAM